jgi:hypothetical protein
MSIYYIMATSFSFGGRSGEPGENHRPWASNWETLSLAAAYKAKKDETELSDMTGRFLDLSLMLQMALLVFENFTASLVDLMVANVHLLAPLTHTRQRAVIS